MAKHRTKRQRRRHRSELALTTILGAAVIAFALLIYQAVRPQPGVAVPDLGNQHITFPQQGTYNSTPPTSGPHYTSLAPWGIHTDPIPNELQVHNLEHGGVMVQYNCDGACPELVAQLAEIVERYDGYVILAPYPDMESRIALTAWGRIDTFDAFDEQRIVRFIQAYRGIDHHR